MGFFSNIRIINYQRKEIERLEKNLKKISNGDFDIDLEVSVGENCVESEREHFVKLNQYLLKIKESFSNLAKDTQNMSSNIKDGNLDYRMDTTRYTGLYSIIGKDINASMEAVAVPFNDACNILENMALNDYTLSMNIDCKGDFSVLANAINDVQKRLLALQGVAIKISNGDISELDNFRKLGKRSENDYIAPAFTSMMEAIQALIDDTIELADAAINGDLNARGHADKFKGEYVGIINGINKTLDAVVKPMREVTEVMGKMGNGNLNVSVKGNYKGEYLTLVNAVNDTVEIIRNVVQEINDIMSEIAQQNLNITTVREFKGDFATISVSLNKIINGLNQILGDINTAAEQVAAGAGQVSDSSQALSQGSEEQASSVEEVTASITQMAAQVKQNASNANEADKLSLTAKEDAERGNEQMKAMLTSMHDINESSSNISKIIKVIDEIAFQTNILALNAAVEAARAGQYGKGFAVVAEEVRNLAARSASAAKETTDMIESSIDKVEKGTKIANDTAKALIEIVDSIAKASVLVAEITSASNEQASAISQVDQAINQVSQVVQTNSATAEESASASEELSSQAEMMKQLVSNFKLRKNVAVANKYEELSPEILKMLEDMYEKKKPNVMSLRDDNEELDPTKIKISLSDKEFDKY